MLFFCFLPPTTTTHQSPPTLVHPFVLHEFDAATISYAVYRDSLAALLAQRQAAKEAADSGGTKKENKPKIMTGEDVVGFHVAVTFLQIEFIGGVWDEESLEKYKAMDHEEQDVLNRMLCK